MIVSGLRLVAAAPTPALRRGQFGGDQDLDEGGTNAALAIRGTFARSGVGVCGPSKACRQTAWALGGDPVIDPALADVDYGTWTGLTPDRVNGMASWLTDPDFTGHGGESLSAVRRRVGAWMDARSGERLVAVAHPTVVRAALAHALSLPPDGIWRVEVGPLTVLRLTHRAGRWHLHL